MIENSLVVVVMPNVLKPNSSNKKSSFFPYAYLSLHLALEAKLFARELLSSFRGDLHLTYS